jgi:cobalamin transport system permease protein
VTAGSGPGRALTVAAVLLAAAIVTGVSVGPAAVPLGEVFGALAMHLPWHPAVSVPAADAAIVWQIRLPRVLLGGLVGSMLAGSGAAYQGVFRNPLADPYLLGVAAGAGLGATLAIGYGGGAREFVPLAAFIGAGASVVCAYLLGRTAGGARTVGTLILAGVTTAAFMTAAQTFVQQQRQQSLREVYSWLLGGLATASWNDCLLAGPYIVCSATVILLHRRLLDVLSVGDEEAAGLGLDVRRVRLVIVAAATIGTAAAVAVSGLIGFVGIIVPHTVRLLVSTSYRAVVPLALVTGAGFLVLTDVLARTVLSPSELPIGVVTAFLGAPFFAIVLKTTRVGR